MFRSPLSQIFQLGVAVYKVNALVSVLIGAGLLFFLVVVVDLSAGRPLKNAADRGAADRVGLSQ